MFCPVCSDLCGLPILLLLLLRPETKTRSPVGLSLSRGDPLSLRRSGAGWGVRGGGDVPGWLTNHGPPPSPISPPPPSSSSSSEPLFLFSYQLKPVWTAAQMTEGHKEGDNDRRTLVVFHRRRVCANVCVRAVCVCVCVGKVRVYHKASLVCRK